MRRREFIAGVFGAAAALPLGARAQQALLPTIGFIDTGFGYGQSIIVGFRRGLGEQGYAEGRNVEITYRWAEDQYDRLPALVADLVQRKVAVIVATGGSAPALVAKAATSTIPIIFTTAADPVFLGLVESFNRPGGNLTGVSFLAEALVPRRLELLHELAPAAGLVGYLVNPNSPQIGARIRDAESAADKLGVRLTTLRAHNVSELEAVFGTLSAQGIGALLADADPFFVNNRDQVVALAARQALPVIYQVREIVEAGGLISYGPNLGDVFRLAGNYAGRLLKGEKPAELPVQQPTRFEMVLNLKTAKSLGLAVPETLLATADEVIE
jgi:putative ABC transport system substrate-binding protein